MWKIKNFYEKFQGFTKKYILSKVVLITKIRKPRDYF